MSFFGSRIRSTSVRLVFGSVASLFLEIFCFFIASASCHATTSLTACACASSKMPSSLRKPRTGDGRSFALRLHRHFRHAARRGLSRRGYRLVLNHRLSPRSPRDLQRSLSQRAGISSAAVNGSGTAPQVTSDASFVFYVRQVIDGRERNCFCWTWPADQSTNPESRDEQSGDKGEGRPGVGSKSADALRFQENAVAVDVDQVGFDLVVRQPSGDSPVDLPTHTGRLGRLMNRHRLLPTAGCYKDGVEAIGPLLLRGCQWPIGGLDRNCRSEQNQRE